MSEQPEFYMWDEPGRLWIIEGIVMERETKVYSKIIDEHLLVPPHILESQCHAIHSLTKYIQSFLSLIVRWW